MAINITIEKKHLYIILVVIVLFATMIFVFAATIPNPGHGASEISGTFGNENYVFPGSLTISSTGGNVPHGCYFKSTHSASASTLTTTCAAGEITSGGGVACGSSSYPSRTVEPASDLTYWTGTCSGTADMYSYAVCCKI